MAERRIRCYFRLLGAHVHCRIFATGKNNRSALVGNLIFLEEDWLMMRRQLQVIMEVWPDGEPQ